MKRYLKSLVGFVTAFSFIFIVSSAWASNGLRVISFGPVSLGMGGAGVGMAQTSNSIFINPAGMNDVGNQVDLNFTAAFLSNFMGTSLAPAGNPQAVRVKGTDDAAFLPNGSIVFDLHGSDRLVLGVGSAFSAGFNVEFPVSRFNSAITKNQYDRSGKYANFKLVPAASFRILDNLSLGVGLDINYALFSTDSAIVAPGFPETVGRSRTDSTLGIGGRVGIQYKPLKWLQVGATYVTRSHFQPFHRYLDLVPTGLDLPQEAALGLAFKPLKGLSVLTDFRWINWNSGFFGQSLALGGLDWRDQYVIAAGAAYDLDTTKWEIPLILRVGFNFARTPIRNRAVFQNVLIPATTEAHITAGFSYELSSHIGMDAAYIHEFENSVTQDASGSPTGRGAFTGTSVDAFSIGIHAKWGGQKKETKESKEAQARAD